MELNGIKELCYIYNRTMTSENEENYFKKPEGYKNINVSASIASVKKINHKNS